MCFYCMNPVLKIKKGETANLNLTLIPLMLEPQKCLLVFRDPKVGEFQYEVSGLVEPPQLNPDVLKLGQLLTNKKYSLSLTIPARNESLNKGRKLVEAMI